MHRPAEPIWPPSPPAEPAFDAAARAWTLSRYAEVEAAMRHPALRQASVDGRDVDVADDPGHGTLLEELRADTERLLDPSWRERMAELALELMNRAAGPAPVDLVEAVIRPWSTLLGLEFGGVDPKAARRLGRIARIFSLTHERPSPLLRGPLAGSIGKAWRAWRHRRAQSELGRLIEEKRIQVGRALYASTTQTLPSFLAKAWHALLLHPDQMDQLRAAPERMPAAVEELLRYAGIVRSLRRRATAPVAIGEAAIAPGDLVVLQTEAANRDPARFRIPERLDLTRKPTGNLGLGVGAHACPGAAIVRHVLAVTTPVFLAAHPRLDPERAVTWKGDPTISWPAEIPVFLEKQPASPPAPSPAPDRAPTVPGPGNLCRGISDPGQEEGIRGSAHPNELR